MQHRRATLTDQQRETILQQRRNLIRQPSLMTLPRVHPKITYPNLFVYPSCMGFQARPTMLYASVIIYIVIKYLTVVDSRECMELFRTSRNPPYNNRLNCIGTNVVKQNKKSIYNEF